MDRCPASPLRMSIGDQRISRPDAQGDCVVENNAVTFGPDLLQAAAGQCFQMSEQLSLSDLLAETCCWIPKALGLSLRVEGFHDLRLIPRRIPSGGRGQASGSGRFSSPVPPSPLVICTAYILSLRFSHRNPHSL